MIFLMASSYSKAFSPKSLKLYSIALLTVPFAIEMFSGIVNTPSLSVQSLMSIIVNKLKLFGFSPSINTKKCRVINRYTKKRETLAVTRFTVEAFELTFLPKQATGDLTLIYDSN